jgi:hypothetical protein
MEFFYPGYFFIFEFDFEFEFEFEFPMTLFMLGGEMFVTFAGMAGLTLVSAFTTYPVLVFWPRMFAVLVVFELFAAVLHAPSRAPTANNRIG